MNIIDRLREELSGINIVFKDGYEEKIDSITDIFYSYTYEFIESIFGLPFKFITKYRGCDGDHDSYHWVFSLGDKTYMINGSYCSDSGTECYNDITEVQQIEVLVKEWVPITEIEKMCKHENISNFIPEDGPHYMCNDCAERVEADD